MFNDYICRLYLRLNYQHRFNEIIIASRSEPTKLIVLLKCAVHTADNECRPIDRRDDWNEKTLAWIENAVGCNINMRARAHLNSFNVRATRV